MAKIENGFTHTDMPNNVFDKLELSDEEHKCIKEFIELASKLPSGYTSDAESCMKAFRFLAARKFEVSRAIELYRCHQRLRNSEGLNAVDPLDEGVRKELLSGKFSILFNRDETGASIALFTARHHWPPNTTQRDTLKGLILQLDAALTSEATQRNGVIFIYDMTGSKYSNFDYDLSIKILNMLKGAYPARLRKVLIVTAPLWFRAPFQVLRLFVREKLRDRVFTLDRASLSTHLPLEAIPRQLGGTVEHDHLAWLAKALWILGVVVPTDYLVAPVSPSSAVVVRDNGGGSAGGSSESLLFSSGASSWSSSGGRHTQPEKQSEEETEKGSTCRANGGGHQQDQQCRSGNKRGKAADDSPDRQAAVCLKKRVSEEYAPLLRPCVHTRDQPGLTLTEIVALVEAGRQRGLVREYLTQVHAATADKEDMVIEVFKENQNRPKNRYVDVYCYDNTRVRLETSSEGDYIHANWVDSYRQKNAFICTQGPLPTTANDFWIMVWENNVPIIVMTTRTVENRRTKCFQYWPAEEGHVYAVGPQDHPIEVTNMGYEVTEDYRITKFLLHNTATGDEREVSHFYFLTWPDHGIPTGAAGFLQYLSAVNDRYKECIAALGYTSAMDQEVPPPPIVVHCSAGIGRTGTFITMDICLKRLADVGTVDLLGTVIRLRQQRYGCIQVPLQYVFCYRALLEHAVDQGLIPSGVRMDSSSEDEDQD